MRTAVEVLEEVMSHVTNAGEPISVKYANGEWGVTLPDDLIAEAYEVIDHG